MSKESGMNYSPEGRSCAVVAPGVFKVGVIGLDHGHIYGMCRGLKEAGADIYKVYDPDKAKVDAFLDKFPQAIPSDEESIYSDDDIKLIATAAIPCNRHSIGLKAMDYGKDFFSDKPPFTTQKQVDEARAKAAETGCRWFVYYSERLHVEAALYAEKLIKEKAIGDVVEIRSAGPHRLRMETRPDWFFEKEKYGGILVDIASHQVEQFLTFAGADDARLISSRVGNLGHKDKPGLEDFGDAMFITDNGIPCYINVDWFTPDGLGTWGDGRTFIVGTKGYIELRKYIDVASSSDSNHVIIVDEESERHICVTGQVGFPFFGQMILDIMNRTENAISQEHVFRAIELAIEAEEKAVVVQ